MGCVSIVFPGHVSKESMSALVVELIQYFLYMRGQFPFTFTEGLKYVNQLQTRHWSNAEVNLNKTSEQKSNFDVYRDSPCTALERSVVADQENTHFSKTHQLKKTEQELVQSVLNFETYFQKLSALLCNHEIQEVVLNFGKNFRMPKELFQIKLPGRCTYSDCGEKTLAFECCKHYLFRTLIGSQKLFDDLPSEVLFPVSVMLLTTSDMAITEYLEQKPFYSVPIKKRSSEIKLTYRCQQPCYDFKTSLENSDCDVDTFAENTKKLPLGDERSSSGLTSNLWVQVKPVLKGFRGKY